MGELLLEAIFFIGRVLSYIFFQFLFEGLFYMTGNIILSPFVKTKVKSKYSKKNNDYFSIFVGLIFWVVVIILIFIFFIK